MDAEADDPMFDALLSEALGGPAPPDLSRQIMAALDSGTTHSGVPKIGGEEEPLVAGPPPKFNEPSFNDPSVLGSLIKDASRVELSDSGRHLILGPLDDLAGNAMVASPSRPSDVSTHVMATRAVNDGNRKGVGRELRRGDRRDDARRLPMRLWRIGLVSGAVVVLFALAFGRPYLEKVRTTAEDNRGLNGFERPSGVDQEKEPKLVADGSPDQAAVVGDAQSGNLVGDATEARKKSPSKVARELQLPNFGEDALELPGNLNGELGPRSVDGTLASGSGIATSETGPASVAVDSAGNRFGVEYPDAPEALGDAAVVAMIDQGLERYWQDQQVERSEEVSWDEFRGRISGWLGIDVQLDSENVVESIHSNLQITEVKNKLARLLASSLLGPTGTTRLNVPQQSAFVKYLEPTIQGERAFDETAVSLVTARGSIDPGSLQFQPSALWYGALAGSRGVPIVEQFGDALLGVDLKCGRCHDHPLDARVWQEQYWQLTAVFETGIRWSVGIDGQLQVEGVDRQGTAEWPVIFFELPDGRQRAAMPKPPARWFGEIREDAGKGFDAEGNDPLGWIAAALDGSPQVARAAVNRAWEIVYGVPLVGSAADPSVAPENAALVELQEQIAAQFRARNYDFGRLLSWVASAKPMRMDAPAVFDWPAVESAKPEDLRLALKQAQAFAAYPKTVSRQPLKRTLVLAQVGIRGREPREIEASGEANTLLGQFQEPGGQAARKTEGVGKKATPEQLLRAVLDAEVAGGVDPLPVSWLQRVWGADPYLARVEHLYYLAGYDQPTSWQIDTAQGLREALGDDSAALRRLWWALSHAQE